MFRWLGAVAPPLVAIALFLLPSAAQAVTVNYTTSGAFTAGPGDSVNGSGALVAAGSGETILSFVGNLSGTANTPATNRSLGKFTLDFGAATEAFSTMSSFALTINQTLPSALGGSTSSPIIGSVVYSGGLTSAGSVSLVFSPNPVIIDNIAYVINPFTLVFDANQPGAVTGTLTASILAVPLPAAAWGGMALFGVLGGAKLRRSRQSVMA